MIVRESHGFDPPRPLTLIDENIKWGSKRILRHFL